MVLVSDLRRDVLLLDVGLGSYDIGIYYDSDLRLNFIHFFDANKKYINLSLPPGSWKIEGICSEVGEDVWRGIVEQWDSGKWNDYERFLARVDTALESGLSLVKSKNLNAERTILLTRK